MQMIEKFCYVGMLLVLIGCATTMSDRASRIRIITAEEANRPDRIIRSVTTYLWLVG